MCPACAPCVGYPILSGPRRGEGLDAYGFNLVRGEVKGGFMRAAHDALVLQLWHELRAAGAVPRREAFGIFSHKINQAARRAGTDDKRREGKVPDLELDPFRRTGPDPVYKEHTLLEHKTVSYGLQYQHAITRRCHVVATRAGKVPGEYRSALRKADRDFNGTPRGTVGPAEALLATFRLVPLVVGHFAEGSEGLLDLIGRTARALSAHRWRSLAFKGPVGGVAPAQWGISRRVGVCVARANAQRLIRCLTQVEAHGGIRDAGAEPRHGWQHTQAREFDGEDFYRAGYGG